MIAQGASKARGGRGVVLGNLADDCREIVYRPFRIEEFVIQFGKSALIFSAGTTRPASASRMPSSMAARGFLVFVLEDGSGSLGIEFLRLSQ